MLQEWGHRNRRAFWYAPVALVIGGLMGISLIGGFIYLVMNGHVKAAVSLLQGDFVPTDNPNKT